MTPERQDQTRRLADVADTLTDRSAYVGDVDTDERLCLDGWFSAQELRALAHALEGRKE